MPTSMFGRTAEAKRRLADIVDRKLVTGRSVANIMLHRHLGRGVTVQVIATPDIEGAFTRQHFEGYISKCLDEGATIFNGKLSCPTVKFPRPIIGPTTKENLAKPTIGVHYPPVDEGLQTIKETKFLKDENIVAEYVNDKGEFVVYTKDSIDDILLNEALVTSVNIVIPMSAVVNTLKRLAEFYIGSSPRICKEVILDAYSNTVISDHFIPGSDGIRWIGKWLDGIKTHPAITLKISTVVVVLSPLELREASPYDIRAKVAGRLIASNSDTKKSSKLYKGLSLNTVLTFNENPIQSALQHIPLAFSIRMQNGGYTSENRQGTKYTISVAVKTSEQKAEAHEALASLVGMYFEESKSIDIKDL